MRGQETANKYKHAAFGFPGRQVRVRAETVADNEVVYRFASADFPISCHEFEWVLKLGPPLG